jgi:poly(A) polymerase
LFQSHSTAHEHLIAESEYQRQLATELVRALQNKNHIAVFAGGSVRDEIMGKLPKDYDIATSASPDQVERLFQQMGHRVIPVGKAFGVINVVVDGREFEIATLRTDGKYIDGRRPESVQFVGSLVEDAARRDLTINAMFKDPISGQIYDYFGGRNDIANGIIRAVGNPRERFAEDNLRMMRIPRFAARYSGFSVDPDTMAAIKSHSVSISGVSGERIREELRGILTAAEPVRGMQIMMNSGLMKEVLPEVYRLRGPKGRQDPDHHPEKTVWTHTKLVLNNLRGGSFERMMGGLLHDVGKPDTQKFWPDGGISNHGHDARGAEITQEIAGRLRLSSQQQGQIIDLVRLHMMMHEVQNLRPAKLTGLLERADVLDLIELQHADAHGTYAARPERSQKEFLLAKLDELKQQGKLGAKPIVDGRALLAINLKPGPSFRLILDAARDAQREGEFSDGPGAERWLRENVNTIIEQSERDAHGK